MALSRAIEVPAADWLLQTHVKSYRNFSRVVIRFFAVVKPLLSTPVCIIQYYG